MPWLAGNHHHGRAMQATWVKATVADRNITRLGSQSCHNLLAVATNTRAELNISCNVRLLSTWTASILEICCSERAKKYNVRVLLFDFTILCLCCCLTLPLFDSTIAYFAFPRCYCFTLYIYYLFSLFLFVLLVIHLKRRGVTIISYETSSTLCGATEVALQHHPIQHTTQITCQHHWILSLPRKKKS